MSIYDGELLDKRLHLLGSLRSRRREGSDTPSVPPEKFARQKALAIVPDCLRADSLSRAERLILLAKI